MELYLKEERMKSVRLFLRSRGAQLAVLLIVLGGTMGLLAPVHDAQSAICGFRPIVRTYYSDATYSTAVGQRGLDCGCNEVFWGVTTPFVKSQTLCCTVNTC
jgi:hypothetical protein